MEPVTTSPLIASELRSIAQMMDAIEKMVWGDDGGPAPVMPVTPGDIELYDANGEMLGVITIMGPNQVEFFPVTRPAGLDRRRS